MDQTPGGNDQVRIALARAYVDALISHDPSALALRPDCTRREMGITTGRSGPHIARSLARGPQFRLLDSVAEFDATDEPDKVTTRYVLRLRPGRLHLAVRVIETFVIDDENRIAAINARFGIPYLLG